MLSIAETMTDDSLFGPWFSGSSWDGWRAVLKAAYALPMTAGEIKFFKSVAGGRQPPAQPVRELWCACGRRSGKDSIASLIAAHAAALFDGQDRLRPGERAMVLNLAVDRPQSGIVLGYTRSYFNDVPMLRDMVTRETANGFELRNGVDVIIATNDFRAVRGRTLLCAIFDEVSFWTAENSARPDLETYRAVLPGLATLPGAVLVAISSPYAKSGLLYAKFSKHFGKDGDVLVICAPSLALNPTLDASIVERAMADDPVAASAEWLAQFRSDIAGFLDAALVEAAVDRGVVVRERVSGVSYWMFVDPSGGSKDSYTACVAHAEGDRAVVDCVVEIRAPLNPTDATARVCEVARSYGLSEVVGDAYAAGFAADAFSRNGIMLRHSERDRSTIYLECLPLFTSGRVRLPDNARMVTQFAALERRTGIGGKDRIDHPVGGHDDIANSVAGALVLCALPRKGGHEGLLRWAKLEAAAIRAYGTPPPPFGYEINGVLNNQPVAYAGAGHELAARALADPVGRVRIKPPVPGSISQLTGTRGEAFVPSSDGSFLVDTSTAKALTKPTWGTMTPWQQVAP